jgi:hypothetical protein
MNCKNKCGVMQKPSVQYTVLKADLLMLDVSDDYPLVPYF